MANTDTAIREGAIKPTTLSAEFKQTSSDDRDTILLNRTRKMVSYLEEAGKANPDDWRIPRWVSMIRLGLNQLEHKETTTKEFNYAAGLAKKDLFGVFIG